MSHTENNDGIKLEGRINENSLQHKIAPGGGGGVSF